MNPKQKENAFYISFINSLEQFGLELNLLNLMKVTELKQGVD